MRPFRTWLQELWFENCNEHDLYSEPRYTINEYFNKYKWWLKREYCHQRKLEQARSDNERRTNSQSRI